MWMPPPKSLFCWPFEDHCWYSSFNSVHYVANTSRNASHLKLNESKGIAPSLESWPEVTVMSERQVKRRWNAILSLSQECAFEWAPYRQKLIHSAHTHTHTSPCWCKCCLFAFPLHFHTINVSRRCESQGRKLNLLWVFLVPSCHCVGRIIIHCLTHAFLGQRLFIQHSG